MTPSAAPDLGQLLEALQLRIKSFAEPLSREEANRAELCRRSFVDLLGEVIEMVNRRQIPRQHRSQVRSTLESLSRLNILPAPIPWPRRYFLELAYRREDIEPHDRFLYRALDQYFRDRGHPGGFEDPALASLKSELERRMLEFHAVRPRPGWTTDAPGATTRYRTRSANDAAFELMRLLVRIFYADGLAVQLLELYKEYEPVLYTTRQYYRDHYVHLVHDFLLGCTMLEGLLETIHRSRCVFVEDQMPMAALRVRLMRAWMLASFFHDVGYPAESLSRIQDHLEEKFFSRVPGFHLTDIKLRHEPYIEDEVRHFLWCLSLILTSTEHDWDDAADIRKAHEEMAWSPEWGPLHATATLLHDQLDDLDHGIASSLFTLIALRVDSHEITVQSDPWAPLATIEKSRETMKAQYRQELKDALQDVLTACLAMALHNLRQHVYEGLSVRFTEHPIAFLLMLCDDLQEWDRRADWELSSHALRTIGGFRVFPRSSTPTELFAERRTIHRTDERPFEQETLFRFLRRRCHGIPRGAGIDRADDGAAGRLAAALQRTAVRRRVPGPEALRRDLEAALADAATSEPVTAILRTVLRNITSDVVTLLFVGGDPNASRKDPENRIMELWKAIKKTATRNLADGPTLCILHGYDETSVRLFCVAEYDPHLREYVLDPVTEFDT